MRLLAARAFSCADWSLVMELVNRLMIAPMFARFAEMFWMALSSWCDGRLGIKLGEHVQCVMPNACELAESMFSPMV